MAENSKIEWTTHTFNPWRGCTKVSAGCANCYAEAQSKRNLKVLGEWGPNGTRIVASKAMWAEPGKWNFKAAMDAGTAKKLGDPPPPRPRVFCASFADVFEDWRGHMVDSQGNVLWFKQGNIVSAGQTTADLVYGERPATMSDVRARLFRLIHETPNLDWLLLTKRPENVSKHLAEYASRIDTYAAESFSKVWSHRLWLGTSVENQATADERIPHLLKVPAAVRFLSCEPLLGQVDLRRGVYQMPEGMGGKVGVGTTLEGIDWVIVGGESGHGARPCDVAWVRSIRDQCRHADVPVLVKQLGAKPFNSAGADWVPGAKEPKKVTGITAGDLLTLAVCIEAMTVDIHDPKGGDPAEWDQDLRVREFPSPGRHPTRNQT